MRAKKTTTKAIKVFQGSGNVFANLGPAQP